MELDELEGDGTHSSPLAVAAACVGLAVVLWFAYKADVKVNNEIKMTDAYVRQAVAQERIADAIAPIVFTRLDTATHNPCPNLAAYTACGGKPGALAPRSGYWPSYER